MHVQGCQVNAENCRSFIMATEYWSKVSDSLPIWINLTGAHLQLVGDDIGGNVLHYYEKLHELCFATRRAFLLDYWTRLEKIYEHFKEKRTLDRDDERCKRHHEKD